MDRLLNKYIEIYLQKTHTEILESIGAYEWTREEWIKSAIRNAIINMDYLPDIEKVCHYIPKIEKETQQQ